MRTTANSSGHAIRPDSPWKSQRLLYLAVFAVTGLAVYRWGLATAQPSRPTNSHTATATVHLRDGLQPGEDLNSIQRQIASKENIDRAVHQLGLPIRPLPNEDPQLAASRALEAVRSNLRVSTDATSLPGQLAVSITHTDQLAHDPARLVNTLAESFAGDYRADWKRRTYRACVEAQEASQHAEREFLQAKARLDAFSQQHFLSNRPASPAPPAGRSQQQSDHGRATSAHLQDRDSRASASAAPSGAPQADNPEWIVLNERLAALSRRLAELLVDRTPLHPEVQDAELRIAALKKQLSGTPRTNPDRPSDQPPAGHQAPAGQGPAHPADLPRTFQTLQESADRASQAYLQAVRLERQAWQEHQREPRIELDLAEVSRAPTSPPPHQPRLLVAALAAGLAVATGVGMISAGTAIQPAFTTVEQVQIALPVPIVGTVPETNPASHPKTTHRRSLMRWALILGGLIVILGCVGSLLWAWAS